MKCMPHKNGDFLEVILACTGSIHFNFKYPASSTIPFYLG